MEDWRSQLYGDGSMKRYLQLWLHFFKMSWMADMEYRLNMVTRILAETGWYLAQLSVFEVLYMHTDTIAGWDVHGMRVFMGTLFFADILYMILFLENLEQFFTLVRRGDLDLYLTKPVDSQFMLSMRKVATAYLINLVLILGYLIWAIRELPQPLTTMQILLFFLLTISGLAIVYAVRFMFSTLIIVLQDAGNIHFLWHQIFRLATRPDPFYPFYLRVFTMTLLPVAFFASVPSRILVEGLDWSLVAGSLALMCVTLYVSHLAWNKALRLYSSASS